MTVAGPSAGALCGPDAKRSGREPVRTRDGPDAKRSGPTGLDARRSGREPVRTLAGLAAERETGRTVDVVDQPHVDDGL